MPSLLHLRCRRSAHLVRSSKEPSAPRKKRTAISKVPALCFSRQPPPPAVQFHRKPVLNVHLMRFRVRKHDFLRLYTVFSFVPFPEGGLAGLVLLVERKYIGGDHRTTPIPTWTTRSDDTLHHYSAGGFMQNFTRFLLLLPLLLLLMATDTTNTAVSRVCGVCLYTDCLTD